MLKRHGRRGRVGCVRRGSGFFLAERINATVVCGLRDGCGDGRGWEVGHIVVVSRKRDGRGIERMIVNAPKAVLQASKRPSLEVAGKGIGHGTMTVPEKGICAA
jgi:hypothetical protein